MKRFGAILLLALIAGCSDGPLAWSGRPDGDQGTGQDVQAKNNGNSVGNQSVDQEPDLRPLAQYTMGERPAQANGVIDAEGGSVRAGDFEIVVPPGAVDRPTLFRIRLPSASGKKRAYAHFESTRPFVLPVTIRLPLAATDADPEASILWWDSDHWVPLATTPTADGRIETTTTHFSVYGTSRFKGITILGG